MNKRLQMLRKEHNLTQKQIAQMLDMSQSGYSKYETGSNDISTKALISLSRYYETNISYILGMTDHKEL